MSQGFYQISFRVAMQSHNSSGCQGPAVIVLAWAGVTWRWGRAERLTRAKLWLFPVCLCVYVCVRVVGMGCGEAPVWSSVSCEPQPLLGMVSKCWPEHQTLCNLLTLLGQEASNSVPMVSKSGVSISHSPPVLQIINPLSF